MTIVKKIDPEKNKVPKNVKSIHLIAICGTGMAALASMLQDMGYDITGSDSMVYPPMSDFLRGRGISIADGFKPENLSHEPDLVVVGNAVSADNAEVIRMVDMGLNYCSMPQALNAFAAKGKKTLLVCGTHGKTTTSSLLAWVLYRAGLDPSFMIGGIVRDFDSNYRLGGGEFLVVEGDEYDTAFFDKGAKFMHYDPHVAVLGNIEFDHADIFKDLDHVKEVFGRFAEKISPSGILMAHDDDADIEDVISPLPSSMVQRYGSIDGSKWRLGRVAVDPPWNSFEVFKDDTLFGSFRARMVGRHNLLNALAVIGVADNVGVCVDDMAAALESFSGVRRRQEVRGVEGGVTVMDDFAHHPTAVRETIRALKPFYPEGRLIAVFEPRTNSSMRKIFQDSYPLSFEDADMVLIREPSMLSKIPPGNRFSAKKLVHDLNAMGRRALHFDDTASIIDCISREALPGDLVLVMSNGGFDNIHARLLDRLRQSP